MPYLINALLTLNVIICLFIILLVLMQRPRNEGLGAAFGGGVTEGLFGTQTTHVLARLTRWLGGMFFVLTLGLGILYSRNFASEKSAVEKRLSEAPVPVATPVPATPAPVVLPGTTPGAPDGGVVPQVPETPAPGTPAPAPTGGVTPPPATPEGTPPAPAPAGTTPAPAAPATPAPATPAPATPAPATPAPAAAVPPQATTPAPAPAK